MNRHFVTKQKSTVLFLAVLLVLCVVPLSSFAETPQGNRPPLVLENDHFRIKVDTGTGAITSFLAKATKVDMVGEPRLAANFRINLPLPDYQANYIDGMKQTPIKVELKDDTITTAFSGMKSDKGTHAIELTYTITLANDQVIFRSKLTNNDKQPVAEFWFPRLGGWTRFGEDRMSRLATPDYTTCGHHCYLFKYFPGAMGLGSEAAEFSRDYPGMVMPWWSIWDQTTNHSLYLGYHDTICRLSTWHTYLYPTTTGSGDSFLTPEQAKGRPVGLVFSHVRYPFIHSGETFDSGEFIVRIHEGDWHRGAKLYREWFMKHFPFDKSKSWLRRQSAWFTSIIYQPEDKIIADFDTYARWCSEARPFGINTFELIGWHKGGLERGYPEYVPEERIGGQAGFHRAIQAIHKQDGHVLAFVNYNILDSATDLYKEKLKPLTHQDLFGATPNWMAWGESTLLARKGLCVRRHLLSSIVPPIQEMLENRFVDIAKAGADGLQIDKVVVSNLLDFNPLNTRKPDEALNQGLVDGIARLHEKCRVVNPDFCLASEALQDRLIPYVDVYYRAAGGFHISPLRYAFPEWTACQHVGAPRDFNGVNAAVMLGAVICVEPQTYQASLADPLYEDLANYIRETERVRDELRDTIFTGDYLDTLEGGVGEVTIAPRSATQPAPAADAVVISPASAAFQPVSTGAVLYRVHGNLRTGRRAIVVINTSQQDRVFTWSFQHRNVSQVQVHAPSQPTFTAKAGDAIRIKAERFQVLLEK